MKKNQIIYWVSTGFISFLMVFSAFNSFSNPEVIEGFRHLGYPDYFRVELGVFKLLGVVVLLLPMVPSVVKEWAYAGFGITFISASIAHFVSGDPISKVIPPLVIFCVLILSYLYLKKKQISKA